MKSKELRYYLFTVSTSIVLLFSSGAIIQSFLAFRGLSPEQIGIYSFCISAIQIVTLLISTFSSDRVKNIPKMTAVYTVPSLLFFVIMLILAAFDKIENNIAFIMSVTACCFWNFFYGLRIVLQYKLPYYIVKISDYPKLETTAGVVSNVICTVVSGAFVFFSKIFDYRNVIFICFVLSSMFAIIAFLSVFFLENKKIETGEDEKEDKKPGFDIFKLKQTQYFILPNIIRGFITGIMGMAAVVMLSTVTSDTSISSLLTVIGTLSAIFSCIIYCRIYKRIKTVKIAVIGGIIQFTGLMFLLRGDSVVFIIMYFIAYFGQTMVDYAVPFYVTEIVPYEYIGGYTAIRMLFFNAGTAIGSYLAGILSTDKAFTLILIGGISQLVHVSSYVLYEKNIRKIVR